MSTGERLIRRDANACLDCGSPKCCATIDQVAQWRTLERAKARISVLEAQLNLCPCGGEAKVCYRCVGQTRIAHLEARVQAADALAKTLDDWQIPLHPYVARELAAYRATEAAP